MRRTATRRIHNPAICRHQQSQGLTLLKLSNTVTILTSQARDANQVDGEPPWYTTCQRSDRARQTVYRSRIAGGRRSCKACAQSSVKSGSDWPEILSCVLNFCHDVCDASFPAFWTKTNTDRGGGLDLLGAGRESKRNGRIRILIFPYAQMKLKCVYHNTVSRNTEPKSTGEERFKSTERIHGSTRKRSASE